jgi:cell wall-associated NlpC family hydrolase
VFAAAYGQYVGARRRRSLYEVRPGRRLADNARAGNVSRFATIVFVAAVAVSSACASHGRSGAAGGPVPRPFPKPEPETEPVTALPPSAAPSRPLDGYGIAGTALSLRGTPYRSGGEDPTGFDCSGLVWFVFAQHGIDVPRTVSGQARLGEPVAASTLAPGDLVFFNTKGVGPTHVGIAIGGDEFVHAPNSSGAVRVERVGSSYWSSRLVDTRRLRPPGAAPCESTAGHSCQ